MNAANLVTHAGVVLLDFDGPVTLLMPPPANAEVASLTRAALGAPAGQLPVTIAETTDHLAVLRYAGEHHTDDLTTVEEACLNAEVLAAQTAAPTDGALELLVACAARRQPIAIVTNNDQACVDAFLEHQAWAHLVTEVVGRTPGRPDLMKPHPATVVAALTSLKASADVSVLIGDSPSDMLAAHAAGVRAIGYAKNHTRRPSLLAAGADAMVDSIHELTA